MRILLDNNVHLPVLRRVLDGLDFTHASRAGWSDLGNGRLIAAAAEAGFTVLVTADRNLRHQQNLATLPLALVVLDLPRNTAPALELHAHSIRSAVERSIHAGVLCVREGGHIERIAGA